MQVLQEQLVLPVRRVCKALWVRPVQPVLREQQVRLAQLVQQVRTEQMVLPVRRVRKALWVRPVQQVHLV
jgi:hypothetical protein